MKFPLTRNELHDEIIGLYVVQAVQVILPIAILPFLARRLGPSNWGTLAYFQSFSLLVAMVVEYGFGLSATRQIARNRESIQHRSEAISQVASAKLLMAVGAILITIALYLSIPTFHSHPAFLLPALFGGLFQGNNMVWYYQGMGRMRDATKVEVLARISAALLSLLLIRNEHDGYLFLLLNAVGAGTATAITAWNASQGLPLSPLSISSGMKGLTEGFTLFLFKSSVSLYTLSNSFILGLVCSPTVVGYYSGSERISKGILAVLNPINQAMYAEINRLMGISKIDAAKQAKKSLILLTLVGLGLGSIVYFAAPLLIRILLGERFLPAVSSTRIMALIPPLMCIGASLGSNWMLPSHLDKQFNITILLAGLINITLAFLLAPRYQQDGMAMSVAACEAFVATSLFCYLRWTRQDPFSILQGESKSSLPPFTVPAPLRDQV